MNAGSSCTINLTFIPSATGTRTASVTITDNASDSPQSISLTGTSISAGIPAVTLSATSLNFGTVKVGSSATKLVTLTNSGTGMLNITITGTSVSDFSRTNTCGFSVNAGASCTTTVTFAPQAMGTRRATVSITDNASNSPLRVNCGGVGG